MHCLGSGGIQQTWQNLAETVDCGRIWQRRQIAANCGGTCGRLRWNLWQIAVETGGNRWRVYKVSRRCPVTLTYHTDFSAINQQQTNVFVNNQPTLYSRALQGDFNAAKIIVYSLVVTAMFCLKYYP